MHSFLLHADRSTSSPLAGEDWPSFRCWSRTPESKAFLAELQERVLASEAPVVVVSVKPFGGTQRLLRFGGNGVCVTVSLVRSTTGVRFLRVLDEMTIAAKGLPPIIKASRLPASVVRACWPEDDRFRSVLLAHDPARVFRSELSTRLGL